MSACPSCGEDNAGSARFCSACGAPLGVQAPPAELRKTVTVLFSDLAGSTALGERLDPESLRGLISRYYEKTRASLERHGGRVQKFIGDAVMAVFGIPTLHEDDALRAVTAAAEARQALEELNVEIGERWGVRLEVKIGINTGEVVVDPAEREGFVVGDVVNVAARLEQSAAAGEILLGEHTYRLVRDGVQAEAIVPMRLRGKAQPIAAFRLLEVVSGERGLPNRLESPLVGREHDLNALREALGRARDEGRCHVLTLLGPAGVGKSRLTEEFVSELGARAAVAKGRCLSYGEGITFWPIAEIVKGAAGISDEDSSEEACKKIAKLLPHEEQQAEFIVQRLAGAVGLSQTVSKPEETFWGIRRFLESLACERPLLAIFDDLQWAEETFLDLIEYLSGFSHGAPILILCMARPELLELRPNWTASLRQARTLQLEPLGPSESNQLIDNLLGPARLAAGAKNRIVAAAEGNPLFVEEMLLMLVDDGLLRRENGRWVPHEGLAAVSAPPTIQALLAARLDRLEPGQRRVIECASVVGHEFWPGAVAELAPDASNAAVWGHLQALVRKEFVQPGGTAFAGEDAFTFSHILMRDTAYDGILKDTRAELHERFAGWLEEKAGERVGEYEEILGYHLEQAFRYGEVLGRVDEPLHELAARAARHLASAGGRAHRRGDMPAAVKLLERSTSLLPADEAAELPGVMLELSHALFEVGDLAGAEAVLVETARRAADRGDRPLELRASLGRADLRVWTDPRGSLEELRRTAEEALPVFEQLGDEVGLAKSWRNIATYHCFACRWGAAVDAMEKALDHARRGQDQQVEAEILPGLASALCAGPTPVGEAIDRLHGMLRRAADDPTSRGASGLASLGTRAAVEAWGLAGLEAMGGRFDEARSLCSRARSVFREVGQRRRLADVGLFAGLIERLADDPCAAEKELRQSYEFLQGMGDKSMLSTVAAELAEAVAMQGREEEAERLTYESEQLAAEEDVESQVRWRVTRAKLLGRRGDLRHAETVAQEAVRRASKTDFPNLYAGALMALADVSRLSNRAEEACRFASQALELYEAKGNSVSAAIARSFLDQPGP